MEPDTDDAAVEVPSDDFFGGDDFEGTISIGALASRCDDASAGVRKKFVTWPRGGEVTIALDGPGEFDDALPELKEGNGNA